MHGPEALVVIFSILGVFGIPGYIIWENNQNRHKERMSILEKGLKPEEYIELYKRQSIGTNPLDSLKWGLVATLVGLGLLIGRFLDRYTGIDEAATPAMMLIMGGLGLVTFYFIAAAKANGEKTA